MDLVIPRGTRLFHGTLEEFDPARLTVGGYDSVLWTTDSPCIAQSYIGCSGLGVIVSAENFNRPSQDLHIQAIQKRIGVDYEYGTARGPTFSDDGRPTAWFPPKGIDREVLNDFWASKKEIRRRILEAGWQPMRSGSDIFEFEFPDGQLLEPGKCAEGRLFIITVEQDLKVYDMTDGGEREGDLMDVDYHKLDVFREAERRGYDGLRINDYAQSKIWGNFGHTSIGVFKGSLGKLSWVAIPAQNFDWPDYETLRRGLTPEYEAWLKTEKTRANPPALDLSRLTIRVCKGADRSHRESRRAYAHTFCRPGPTICVASEFFGLSPGHRDGVLAHEVGHLLAGPSAGEEAADRAFEEATGVRVRYKDGPHGRALQWLSDDSRKSLLGVFEFDFEGHVSDAPGSDDDAVRFFVKDANGKRELGSLREAERAAGEDPDADVWASEGRRRLGWRPMARNPKHPRGALVPLKEQIRHGVDLHGMPIRHNPAGEAWLILVHPGSLDSYADFVESEEAAVSLARAMIAAVMDHDGPVLVADNPDLGDWIHREFMAALLRARSDVTVMRFDEDQQGWPQFLRRLVKRIRLSGAPGSIKVGGIWWQDDLRDGCASTVYEHLLRIFGEGVMVEPDHEILGTEDDE